MNTAEINKMISERFETLIKDATIVINTMYRENEEQRARDKANNVVTMYEYRLCEEIFFKLKTNVISLIEFLPAPRERIVFIIEEVKAINNKISDTEKLLGILKGLNDDFNGGYLKRYSDFIESNIEADYFSQAENILHPTEPLNHIPAAVLLGAILEDALRRLCQRQSPPIAILKPNGENKTMNSLIDDLKQAGLYNELKAKQLRAWADIRNSAAHGKFDEFNRNDVDQMLDGVRNFLADYLA